MESLGFTNIDYAVIESKLGIPNRCSSDPNAHRKPPHDPLLYKKIFADSPTLTDSEWQNPRKVLIKIRTFQVGFHKYQGNIKDFGKNCRVMKMNLDDEQETLSKLRIYGTLGEVGVWILRMEKRIEEREREREKAVKKHEEFVEAGKKKIEMIMERGGGRERSSWWMEKPWYERGEAYNSGEF
ncbi:hypothetical protein TWF788_002060 [Orbilia oligospora]|uniref:Uncharacterized protein n=1 Tax=Orbilia oligospora TaxID=2813651 RepID=A0A7C8K5W5_ORBOL|nr:hypothetical protein TWF788_002060 [Orbilia oligospora]